MGKRLDGEFVSHELFGDSWSESLSPGDVQSNELDGDAYRSGPPGMSVYEVWLSEGNEGSVADFLKTLRQISYIHYQTVASNEWYVEHNLDRKPNVFVIDSAGTMIEPEVQYFSNDILVLRFTNPFIGEAHLGG